MSEGFIGAELARVEAGPAVRLTGVAYAAGGAPLIRGLDLALGGAPLTVIMGPNGAGKSLLLRLIQGLIQPTRGSIQRPPGRLALATQRPVMLRRSAAANLDFALKIYGKPRDGRPGRVASLLKLAGLEGKGDRPARRLSGGEQQRLSVVRALAADPALLLLDEPAASLDPHATEALERLVRRAVSGGARTVLVTHDAGQARRLADEVVFMANGRVTEQTPGEEFFAAPRSEEARAYLAGRLVL